ncbi:hypothetical protein TWF696_003938 [Orbilia brochopaga]|uniref:Uncharacterized protein n=1 Tax=Orbilia brochopaga TaxID=3140254 RepID=A0AAV9V6Y5_9PEZI
MLLKAIGILAASVVVVYGAALPLPPSTTSDISQWNFTDADFDNWESIIWEANLADSNFDDAWLKSIDDAWREVKLMFPITIFNKTSQTIYINMNGIVSLDKPDWDMKTLPERPLPVDPKTCTATPEGGCIPSTAILPLWRDLNLRLLPADLGYGSTVAITFQHHQSYPIPHHHFGWWVCDKAAPLDPATERENCGRATRNIRMTVDVEKPYIFMFDYWIFETPAVRFEGTIGIQSEGQYLSVPASEIHTAAGSSTRIVFDTKAVTVTVTHGSI